jgi:antitoxin MazE
MKTKIQKWGNSLAVRIPQAYVREAQVAYGSEVELSVEEGRIIINPQTVPSYDLEELLKGVTKKNLHPEVDTGEAVGGEFG